MIIKARHHFFIYPFFQRFSLRLIRRNFREVIMYGDYTDKGKPVLLLSNHTGWYDGFWAMYFNIIVLRKKFHFMMLEDQLRKHWYFNYTGGFSVRKSSRSIIESLKYTGEILSDPENMVLMFPQGKIHSSYTKFHVFEKGISRIFEEKRSNIQLIFMANMTDYLSSKKPTLYIYHTEYTGTDHSREAIQDAYNRFYGSCLEKQEQITD